MEISGAMIYWITRLNETKGFLTVLMVISAVFIVIGIVAFIASVEERDGDSKKSMTKFGKRMITVGLAAFLVLFPASVLIPSEKDAAAILILPLIISNQEVQKIPKGMVDLANEWLEELRPEKIKSKIKEKENG